MTQHTKHSQNQKARHLMSRTGYSTGGATKPEVVKAVHEHEAALHKGEPKTPLTLKTGGTVAPANRAAGGRLDKLARGGRKAANVTVNVIASKPDAGPAMPPPMPMAPPPGPPPMPPMGAGPRPGMAPPPGPMGPGGMKTGGRMRKRAGGGMMGEPSQGYSTKPEPKMPSVEKHLASGGRLGGKAAPKMDAGAGSGEGRMEKCKAYGTKPKAK